VTRGDVYHALATSDHGLARFVRRGRRAIAAFTLPAPRILTRPVLYGFLAGRWIYHYLYRLLVCEPLFKAHCKQFGKRVRTGVFTPWIRGPGEIYVGDNVVMIGAYSIQFAARFSENPTLRIGSNTMIGHACCFAIGKQITIGENCLLAREVSLFDSPAHPLNPVARLAGEPCPPDAVKPITIGDNVWIGQRSIICPGVTIGDGAVVGAGAVVLSDVSPNTLVVGNPARRSSYADLTQVAAGPSSHPSPDSKSPQRS